MKKITLIFSILLLLFYSCKNKRREIAISPTTELQSLSLGVMSTLESLPFYIAEKQGIYDSLGLDLSFIRFNSANDRDAAFLSGKIDGMISDYPSGAVLQALYLVNLSFIMRNDGYFCFIVSKESKINQLKQLKQKNIAVSRNTIVEYATYRLLKMYELSLTEINLPEISQIPLRLQMLQYGQIDASFLPDPFASIAMNRGHRSLVSTQELDINITGTAFAQKALIEKKKEIKLLVQGYNLGVEYIQSHPQKEWKQLLVDMGVPENLTGLIALPTYHPASLPSEANIKEAILWLKKYQRISSSYTGEQLIDTTFIHN